MKLLTHLPDNEIFLKLYLALGDVREDHSGAILTEKEQEECLAFTNDKRRREYISTRFLIRKLCHHAGLDPDRVEMKKDNLGKPFGLYDGEHLFMSIAHTDHKILCAMSRQTDIGVDIEPAGRTVNEHLRARILHPEEREQLEHIESIRIWTIKEAAVKLLGSGLRANLNDLIVYPDEKNGFFVRFNDEKTAKICSFKYEDYWISIACFT